MTKSVKLSAKIALDVAMFIILVFLYKAKVLTLTYHEVAGIGIFLVFLIHCLFNWRWIVNSTKKLFNKDTPARTKFSYWISIALIISFLIIVISGIFISKILFRDAIQSLNLDTSIFRTLHLFFSAVSLILVGIHLGLYWNMVKGFFKKKIKLREAIAKPLCYILLAIVVIFGAYSIPTSGFAQWLICPIVPMEHGHGDKGDKGNRGEEQTEAEGDRDGNQAEAEGDRDGNQAEAESDRDDNDRNNDERENKAEGTEEQREDERGERGGHGDGNHGNNITAPIVIRTFAQFSSIMGLFAAVTYYINEALRKRKISKKEQ